MARWLTFPRLVGAITFLAVLAMAARPAVATDTWWQLRTGAWILEHRAIPLTDPFSHTFFGQPWFYPASGWLAQVLLYAVWQAAGYFGLNLFTAAAVLAAMFCIDRTCSGGPLLRAFVLVLAAAASAIFWSARPQILSFALTAVFAWALHAYRWQGRNRLWLLPPLMAVWVNLHGGFALGLAWIGLTLAGQAGSLAARLIAQAPDSAANDAKFEGIDNSPPLLAGFKARRPPGRHGGRWGRGVRPRDPAAAGTSESASGGDLDRHGLLTLAAVLLACLAAACLNPAGPRVLLFPFETASIPVLRDFIQEWQSPDFQAPGAQPFLWLLFAALLAPLVSRRRANFTDVLLAVAAAYAGFLAWRNVTLLAIAAPPLLSRHVAEALFGRRPAPPAPGRKPGLAGALNAVLLAVITVAAVIKVAADARPAANQALVEQASPVGAAEYIQSARPPGPMFNSYNFGGYLVWALYPDYPVFVDGRTDLYTAAFFDEYVRAIAAQPGYAETLARYGIRLVVVETGSSLHLALEQSPDWRLTYRDQRAVVLEKQSGP